MSTSINNPQLHDMFLAGYRDCGLQTIRFLMDHERMDPDHPVIRGLLQLMLSRIQTSFDADDLERSGETTLSNSTSPVENNQQLDAEVNDRSLEDADSRLSWPQKLPFKNELDDSTEFNSTGNDDSGFEVDIIGPQIDILDDQTSDSSVGSSECARLSDPVQQNHVLPDLYANALATHLFNTDPRVRDLLEELCELTD